MIETLLHIIGICPDSFSHIDILDLVSRLGPSFLSSVFNVVTAFIKR